MPTEKGKQLQEPITEIIDEVNEEVLKCFTEEEVTALKTHCVLSQTAAILNKRKAGESSF